MRDRDLGRVFERAGRDVAPDVEFEEDLLLRMEAILGAEDTTGTTHGAVQQSQSSGELITLAADVGGADRPSEPRRRSWLVAASVALVLGAFGAVALLARDQTVDAPAATSPIVGTNVVAPSTSSTTVPIAVALTALSEACTRWRSELASLAERGEPLTGSGIASEDVVGDAVDRLALILADYVSAAELRDDWPDTDVKAAIANVALDVDAELARTARGRWDPARYSVPIAVRELLSINSSLAAAGAEPCS